MDGPNCGEVGRGWAPHGLARPAALQRSRDDPVKIP